MANTRQAKKRVRQSERSRQRNFSLCSMYRTAIKKVLQAVGQGNQAAANEIYRAAMSVIDKMVGKGIMHKNKAARHKSRLMLRINKMV